MNVRKLVMGTFVPSTSVDEAQAGFELTGIQIAPVTPELSVRIAWLQALCEQEGSTESGMLWQEGTPECSLHLPTVWLVVTKASFYFTDAWPDRPAARRTLELSISKFNDFLNSKEETLFVWRDPDLLRALFEDVVK